MTSVRRFKPEDIYRFANVNLDKLTETYHNGFYMEYVCKWPELCYTAESAAHSVMGYVLGKAEGDEEAQELHGHVSAVTVAPEFRRISLARSLMVALEAASEHIHRGFFVDLFVRASNHVAIAMYKRFGYFIHKRVLSYYSGDGEDAYDMRKALSRDSERHSIIPFGRDIQPSEVKW